MTQHRVEREASDFMFSLQLRSSFSHGWRVWRTPGHPSGHMILGHVTHQPTCLHGSSQQESHSMPRRRHIGTTPTVKVSPRHLVLLLLSEEVSHERGNFDKPVASYPGPAHFTVLEATESSVGPGNEANTCWKPFMHFLLLVSMSLTLADSCCHVTESSVLLSVGPS